MKELWIIITANDGDGDSDDLEELLEYSDVIRSFHTEKLAKEEAEKRCKQYDCIVIIAKVTESVQRYIQPKKEIPVVWNKIADMKTKTPKRKPSKGKSKKHTRNHNA